MDNPVPYIALSISLPLVQEHGLHWESLDQGTLHAVLGLPAQVELVVSPTDSREFCEYYQSCSCQGKGDTKLENHNAFPSAWRDHWHVIHHQLLYGFLQCWGL